MESLKTLALRAQDMKNEVQMNVVKNK